MTGGEDACPRCGIRFGDQAKFECPFCGGPVSSEDVRCPSCLVKLHDFVPKIEERVSDQSIDGLLMEIIEKEAKAVKDQGKKLSCPKCSWMVDGSEESCPKCGMRFSDMVAYQCPVCAALVSAETVECGECGSAFLGPPGDTAEAMRDGRPSASPTAMEGDTRPGPMMDQATAKAEPAQPVAAAPERVEVSPAEGPPSKERTKVVLRPKLIKKEEPAKAPAEEDKTVPAPPKKKVRRLKKKTKPKA